MLVTIKFNYNQNKILSLKCLEIVITDVHPPYRPASVRNLIKLIYVVALATRQRRNLSVQLATSVYHTRWKHHTGSFPDRYTEKL